MSVRWAVAVLLLVAALPAPALGQAAALLQDPAGDVKLDIAGQAGPSANSLYPAADLLTLDVVESRSAFTFNLGVAALPTSTDPGVDGVAYSTYFSHNGREFQLVESLNFPAFNQDPFVFLNFRDSPDDGWSGIWFSDTGAILDTTAKSISVDLDRDLLADSDGAAPFPGRSLDGIRVEATSAFGGDNQFSIFGFASSMPQRVSDRMPDDAKDAASVPVQMGVVQSGHARLSSELPFRASNGEATTFLYNVTAENLGDKDDTFELVADNVPPGYTLVLPVPALALDGGNATTVPVLLTMPFGHQHGSVSSLILEMRSLSDPGSVGRLEMGVRFLAIPQPAGHHDTVYLHKAKQQNTLVPFFGSGPSYMNTVEDDAGDAKANLYAQGLSGAGGGRWSYTWNFPLSPTLEMGLDVDPANGGRIVIPVGTTAPMLQTSMEAVLYVQLGGGSDFGGNFGGDAIEIARSAATTNVDVQANSQALIEGQLLPVKGAGRVPFQPGNNLWLEVRVTTAGPPVLAFASDGPYIAPGGFAHLPLREWHDAVDQVLSTLNGPGLTALTSQERLVNPGKAVIFPVSVTNPLNDSATIRFVVSGPNAAWASLADVSLEIPSHGSARTSMVVRAPSDAVDGERADLVLQAYTKDDPTARGLVRLVTVVDTDATQVDDTAAAAQLEHKKSPGPDLGLVLAAGAVALLAFARRRR